MLKCCYPRCRDEATIVHLTKPLCDKHWNLIAEDDIGKFANKVGIIKVGSEWLPEEKVKQKEGE